MSTSTLLTLDSVSFSYPNGTKALDSLNLSLPKGKKIALLGANAAGKSTLFMILNGLLKIDKGTYFYNGEKVKYKKSGVNALRQKVGVVFQNPDKQLFAPSVYEEISFGPKNIGLTNSEIHSAVKKQISYLKLEDIASHNPSELSTGQKKRVAMASILAMDPELIVCDEPSANLDPEHEENLFSILNDLNTKEKTILISTHNVNRAYEWADYIIIMNKGKNIAEGTPEIVFNDESVLSNASLSLPAVLQITRELKLDNTYRSVPDLIKALQAMPEINY